MDENVRHPVAAGRQFGSGLARHAKLHPGGNDRAAPCGPARSKLWEIDPKRLNRPRIFIL